MRHKLLKLLSIIGLVFITNTASAQTTCSFIQPSFTNMFGDIVGGKEYFTSTVVSIICPPGVTYTLKPNLDYIQNGNSILLYQDSAYTKRMSANPIVGTGTGNQIDIPIYAQATSGQGFVYKTGAMTGSITLTLTY